MTRRQSQSDRAVVRSLFFQLLDTTDLSQPLGVSAEYLDAEPSVAEERWGLRGASTPESRKDALIQALDRLERQPEIDCRAVLAVLAEARAMAAQQATRAAARKHYRQDVGPRINKARVHLEAALAQLPDAGPNVKTKIALAIKAVAALEFAPSTHPRGAPPKEWLDRLKASLANLGVTKRVQALLITGSGLDYSKKQQQ